MPQPGSLSRGKKSSHQTATGCIDREQALEPYTTVGEFCSGSVSPSKSSSLPRLPSLVTRRTLTHRIALIPAPTNTKPSNAQNATVDSLLRTDVTPKREHWDFKGATFTLVALWMGCTLTTIVGVAPELFSRYDGSPAIGGTMTTNISFHGAAGTVTGSCGRGTVSDRLRPVSRQPVGARTQLTGLPL